jgi:hypothetical protein
MKVKCNRPLKCVHYNVRRSVRVKTKAKSTSLGNRIEIHDSLAE